MTSEESQNLPRPAVALDGHSGSGKSTLARRLAVALQWAYLDSGAWYRALTWATLEAGASTTESDAVLKTLSQIDITCQTDGTVLVDGRALVDEIRSPLIDTEVSNVADHAEVRQALTLRMRDLRTRSEISGVVADGRDAGSVIFPDAVLKVFVDVSLEVRAQRRFEQQRAVHSSITLLQVHDALAERDRRDACRGEAAPRVLPDSRVLDNSSTTPEEAVGRLLDWVQALA